MKVKYWFLISWLQKTYRIFHLWQLITLHLFIDTVNSISKCTFLHNNNSNNLNAAMSGFIYSDRKTSVKGTDTEYRGIYDFTLQKGWNELVKKKLTIRTIMALFQIWLHQT